MKPIIVRPKNRTEYKFINDLLKKLNIDSRVLSLEELEDIGMSILMREAVQSKKVSRETVLKKLQA
jgi:7-cyano-7-deazaguanine synthase in queuosine biosynthesis